MPRGYTTPRCGPPTPVPRAERPPRPHLLPRHPAAPPGPAARRARAVRLRPVRRRDRRRPRRHRAPAAKAARIDALAEQLAVALDGGPAAHPVLAALADTARRYAIDRAHFADFLVSMRMDTEVTDYATFADLDRYVHGSAAVIGLQMLPILGTTVPTRGRRARRRRARRGVPAHQLPPRRRRGPRPRPRLPARRRAGRVRRRPGAAGLVAAHPAFRSAHRAGRWPTSWRTPGRSTAAPHPGSPCSSRSRARA